VTTRAFAAVILAIVVAGCGGDAVPAATTGSIESTVEQFAGLVAGHGAEWRENVASIHDVCADSNAADRCAAAHRAAGEQAEAFHLALTAAHDLQCQAHPECSGYLGEVPSAIATLVADTETAALEYSTAFDAWDATDCISPLNWHCGADEQLAMSEALGELTRQFDAWKEHTNR
jgi:hypothetical protein